METRLLLIVRDDAARDAYLPALVKHGVAVDTLGSLADMQKALVDTAYSGILLDVGVMVNADASEKSLVSDILELFPVLRLRWDRQREEIQTLFFGQTSDDHIDLAGFITRHCVPFTPRSLRANLRREVHLNVLLSSDPNLADDRTWRTNTLNLSAGGCFVLSAEDWSGQSEAWLSVRELEDRTPIRARVAWFRPWGTRLQVGGVGLEFTEGTPAQRDELSRLLLKK